MNQSQSTTTPATLASPAHATDGWAQIFIRLAVGLMQAG